jgi:hypothetical protein
MNRNRNPRERYHFRPCLEPLEDRTAAAPFSVGAVAQQGSLLAVGVASSVISTTMILQDGQGDVAVSLNGGDFQIFNGVSNIQVFAQGLGMLSLSSRRRRSRYRSSWP